MKREYLLQKSCYHCRPFVHEKNRSCTIFLFLKRIRYDDFAVQNRYEGERGRNGCVNMEIENNKENGKEPECRHFSVISNTWYFTKLFWMYEPIVLFLCGIEIVLAAIMPLIGIYLPKLTIDMITEGVTIQRLMGVLIPFTIGMMLLYGGYSAAEYGKYHLYNMQRTNFMGMLFLKSQRVKYAYEESGKVKNLYWQAQNALSSGDWSASSRFVSDTVGLLRNILCFFLYSTVLSTLNAWMVIALIGISLLNYLVSMYEIRFAEKLRQEKATVQKRYYYVKSVMGNTKAAKDIRLFHMGTWLKSLLNKVIDEQSVLHRKLGDRRTVCEQLTYLLAVIRDVAAYAFLVYQVSEGRIGVSDFVLYFGAVTGFSNFVTNIMGNIASLRDASNMADSFRTYMELAEEDEESGSRHISELSMPLEIEFRDVCFSYEEDVLFDHFNLTIHAGEKLAIVGVNGAGKTTLVKLLCGLYEPDSGEIRINGIDSRSFPKGEWYQLFSAVFQEQLILPFTVGENLSMDCKERLDEKKAWEALEKAGLRSVFEEKGIKMDSFMKKSLSKDGVELSGGQQQRFLLARALYKNAPILILDEPTAALDPIAESEIYDCYQQYSDGKTSVFISHRLASTSFSDRIIMLEHGRVAESGTHEELMQSGGAYAKMYQVQSNYYEKEEGCEDGIESDGQASFEGAY